jgi:pimeloyl-ACP methyl ester carboxylesterase
MWMSSVFSLALFSRNFTLDNGINIRFGGDFESEFVSFVFPGGAGAPIDEDVFVDSPGILWATYDPCGVRASKDCTIRTNYEVYEEDAKATFVQTLSHLNRTRGTVVGYSGGCFLAQYVEDQVPQLIHKVVLIAPVMNYPEAIQISNRCVEERLGLYQGFVNWIGDFFRRSIHYALCGTNCYNNRDSLSCIIDYARSSDLSTMDSIRSNQQRRYIAHSYLLQSIKMKFMHNVTFIVGEKDLIAPCSLVEKYYPSIEAPDKSLIVLKDSSHLLYLDEPTAFKNAIDQSV